MIGFGTFNEVGIVVGRDEHDGDGDSCLMQRFGSLNTIHLGHADVGDRQIGCRALALLDELLSRSGNRDDSMTQPWQDALKVLLHVGFIISNSDTKRPVHATLTGNRESLCLRLTITGGAVVDPVGAAGNCNRRN